MSDRKEKTKGLLEFHKETFNKINIKNPYFVAKYCYKPKGKTEHYVSFFESELEKNTDIYLEFTDSSLVPEDENRTLYKYLSNEHFKEEYECVEGRYLVPVNELLIIKSYLVDNKTTMKFDSFKSDFEKNIDDISIKEMSIRDFYAIMHNKPVSQKSWLNKLISNNQ